MLNQGQFYSTKKAASDRAAIERKKGNKAYFRRALIAKNDAHIPVTKRKDMKLGWLATWERK